MIRKISARGFKSLQNLVDLDLPQMSVFFGPNAAGKSNVIDAIQALSRFAACNTLGDALKEPIRGYPIETFSFPSGGLRGLLDQEHATFELGVLVQLEQDQYEYKLGIQIVPSTGALSVTSEYLAAIGSQGRQKGNALISPYPEESGKELHIRRKSKPGYPRTEPLGLNHTILSDLRLGGLEYRGIEKCRRELSGWRAYYLDPRMSMRRPAPPAEVQDIGVLGENIAPFLYRLQETEEKHFKAVRRLLVTLIPSVENVTVDLDRRRGTLDVVVRQNGIDFSSRVLSEGTLRMLALCAITVNPWATPVMAFEEPENGVQPRRMELIADLLCSIALQSEKQVIVTTHSPLFVASVIRTIRQSGTPEGRIGLFNVRRTSDGTQIEPFDVAGPLFQDQEVKDALTDRGEDGLFEGLALRGMLDE
jgi:predicted ATPase